MGYTFKGDIGPYRAYVLGYVGSIFWALGCHVEPREGEPRQPNKAYRGPSGAIRPHWAALAPLALALVAYMSSAVCSGFRPRTHSFLPKVGNEGICLKSYRDSNYGFEGIFLN